MRCCSLLFFCFFPSIRSRVEFRDLSMSCLSQVRSTADCHIVYINDHFAASKARSATHAAPLIHTNCYADRLESPDISSGPSADKCGPTLAYE